MYADRVDAQANRSIKERLECNSSAGWRNIFGKRRREDDGKWKHDLFEKNRPQVSNLRVGATDLRLKLQKRIIEQSAQHVRGSASGSVRDLREKLSGTVYSLPIASKNLSLRPNHAPESSKPPSNVIDEAPERELKKIARTVTKKMTPQKIVCAKVREGDQRIVRIKEGNPKGHHVVIVDDLVQSGGILTECNGRCNGRLGEFDDEGT